ncbi:DUF1883 domain-containing protein [Kitasatospora cineracea]|uniref:DUF1883 domain-containing protein n=1 Tax=Kitasatospora cineracea TaxID=88074 RepID=UPI0036C1F791
MPDQRGVSLALAPLPAAAGPGMHRLSERTQRRCIWRTTQRSPVHVQRATMNFVVHDLGRQPKGAVAVINLSGGAANVRLMDPSNYRSYKSGGRHKYFGGLATRSPVRLAIPSGGQWYVTVDMAGLRGNVRSSVRMEPPPLPALPPIRQGRSRRSDMNHRPQKSWRRRCVRCSSLMRARTRRMWRPRWLDACRTPACRCGWMFWS